MSGGPRSSRADASGRLDDRDRVPNSGGYGDPLERDPELVAPTCWTASRRSSWPSATTASSSIRTRWRSTSRRRRGRARSAPRLSLREVHRRIVQGAVACGLGAPVRLECGSGAQPARGRPPPPAHTRAPGPSRSGRGRRAARTPTTTGARRRRRIVGNRHAQDARVGGGHRQDLVERGRVDPLRSGDRAGFRDSNHRRTGDEVVAQLRGLSGAGCPDTYDQLSADVTEEASPHARRRPPVLPPSPTASARLRRAARRIPAHQARRCRGSELAGQPARKRRRARRHVDERPHAAFRDRPGHVLDSPLPTAATRSRRRRRRPLVVPLERRAHRPSVPARDRGRRRRRRGRRRPDSAPSAAPSSQFR